MVEADTLEEIKFDVICDIFGEDLFVTYKPMSTKCNEEAPTPDVMGMLMLTQSMVVSWDLLESDKTPVPLTTERLASLPMIFINMVMEQIISDREKRSARSMQAMRERNNPMNGDITYAG